MKTLDILIIGGGAAGCMAAIEAGKRGFTTLLLDHGKRVGGKIPISGGGRCNFTNTGCDWTHFQSKNPRFSASILSRFSPSDFIQLVDKHHIAWHEKHRGQLFCDGSATQVVEMLEKKLKDSKVELLLKTKVESVTRNENGFKVEVTGGDIQAANLVIATGGLSYAALGATDFGLKLAKQFGHTIIETAPALDGFVLGEPAASAFNSLTGISLEKVRISTGGKSVNESMLFTHKGLSGPAALQASLYWKPGQAIEIDLLPEIDLAVEMQSYKKKNPKGWPMEVLEAHWPRRLTTAWTQYAKPSTEPNARWSDQQLNDLARGIKAWTLTPVSSTGYHKAEVTRGGVNTDEIHSKTMESKKEKGLYFIGEVVDMTGELGGYNFQWAWASGYVCGISIERSNAIRELS